MLAAGCAREHAAHRIGLESAGPQSLKLARRAREHDDDAVAEVEHEPRRGPGEPERDASPPVESPACARPGRSRRTTGRAVPRSCARRCRSAPRAPRRPPAVARRRARRARPCDRRASARARPETRQRSAFERFSERVLEIVDAVADDRESTPAPGRDGRPRPRETDRCGPDARRGRARSPLRRLPRAGGSRCRPERSSARSRRTSYRSEGRRDSRSAGRRTFCGSASASWRLFALERLPLTLLERPAVEQLPGRRRLAHLHPRAARARAHDEPCRPLRASASMRPRPDPDGEPGNLLALRPAELPRRDHESGRDRDRDERDGCDAATREARAPAEAEAPDARATAHRPRRP